MKLLHTLGLIAILALPLLAGCAATGGHSASWEYKVVEGWIDNATRGGATFEEHLNKAAVDGWEVVSVSASGDNGRPFAVLRRHRN